MILNIYNLTRSRSLFIGNWYSYVKPAYLLYLKDQIIKQCVLVAIVIRKLLVSYVAVVIIQLMSNDIKNLGREVDIIRQSFIDPVLFST